MKDKKRYVVTTTDGVFLAYRVVEENDDELDDIICYDEDEEEQNYDDAISEQYYNVSDDELICAFHPGTQHNGVDIKDEADITLRIARRVFKESASNLELYKEKSKRYCKTRN